MAGFSGKTVRESQLRKWRVVIRSNQPTVSSVAGGPAKNPNLLVKEKVVRAASVDRITNEQKRGGDVLSFALLK